MKDYSKNKLNLCYIAGITQRSGTNFLFKLIRCHPKCWGLGPIWEDFLLTESDALIEYADSVSKKWGPAWDVSAKMGDSGNIALALGAGLKNFLIGQLSSSVLSRQLADESDDPPAQDISMLVTKTPDSKGIENFFTLFPEEYLILIVRDGRSAVESGVITFGWDYEESIKLWAKSAKRIYDFYSGQQEKQRNVILVKYEDLIENETMVIETIINFLGLNINEYPFDKSKKIGISGSSIAGRRTNPRTFWREKPKDDGFNPLVRFENWESSLIKKFNSIAGEYMIKLGYDIDMM